VNQGIAYEIAQTMPLAYALGVFGSLANFVAPNQTQGATGNPIGGYAAVPGIPANIPAMDAPRSVMAISSDETRALTHIEAERQRHMLLNGYFPLLDTGFSQGAGLGWQVAVTNPNGDVNMYDFLGGEADSQAQMTRVKMMLVTT
jgi:hypothetical protein